MPPRSLSPDEALHYLSGVTDWEDFIEEAQELRMRVDLSCVTKMDPKANIPSHLIDKTYVKVIINAYYTMYIHFYH